ncbi:hypothetical protein [Phytoactinopolyspora mesophila]|uniref:Uncharacterized protein n=1 Tax=Phytoactinopolyspora mesophila TaxID=2650750 RepID=A0A7K3M9C0_9ACTN|nr:hypothetical protein [Phytoactinopolyspora mesophila]NDL59915.1 hypothetical protein [Phytoactinopolyspora mesophila]
MNVHRTGPAHLARRRLMTVITATLAAAAVTLVGCGSDDDGGQAGGTSLQQALSRVSATDATVTYIEFGDAERIREASGGSFKGVWGSLDGWGSSTLAQYRRQVPEVLGIDPEAAQMYLTVGQPPETVTLLQGGQDAEAITSASTASGWTGEDTLTLEMDPTQPISISSPHIRPLADDVVVGGTAADLGVVDADGEDTTLAGAPVVGELADCLGDVFAAYFIDSEAYPTALGVRPAEDDPESPVSIMCVLTPSVSDAERLAEEIPSTVAEGDMPSQGRPYAIMFEAAEAEILDGEHVVRVELEHTDGALANVIFQMVFKRDLPVVSLGDPAAELSDDDTP